MTKKSERDSKYKQKLKTYHDARHRARRHKFNVGKAVLLKREQKRKGETPFEPHIYIITKIIGSTIQARRANDQKTVCRDASKFKLLRTDDFPTEDKERETSTIQVVPPTYSTVQK